MASGEGGFAGGLASGLQSGMQFGSNIYNEQANRDLKKQEMAQQAGFENRRLTLEEAQGKRADLMNRLQVSQAKHAMLQDQHKKLVNDRAALAGREDISPEDRTRSLQHFDDLLKQNSDDINSETEYAQAQTIDGMLDRNQRNLQALKNGDIDIHQLSPLEQSHAVAPGAGGVATDVVHGPDHISDSNPTGQAPVQVALDRASGHMENGNLLDAHQSLFPVLGPHMSQHDDSHPAYFPGFSVGGQMAQTGDPHAWMGQAQQMAGMKASLVAAVNSDPLLVKNIWDVAPTATAQQQQAMHALAVYGGRNGLKDAAAPNDTERQYTQNVQANKAKGMDPKQAHTEAVKQTVMDEEEAQKARMRQSYLDTDPSEMPPSLQEPEAEKKRKALLAAGFSPKQATLYSYAEGVATEQMRISAEAPLRNAQAAYYSRRGFKSFVDPTSGSIYTQDPQNPSAYLDSQGNEVTPDIAKRLKPLDKANVGPGSVPKIVMVDVQPSKENHYIKSKKPMVEQPDGTLRAATESEVAAAGSSPAAAAAPAAGDSAPSYINPKTGKPYGT